MDELVAIDPGAALPPGRNWALLLDIDGTMIDLAATPDTVIVPDSLKATLSALVGRFGGAVALVSGRSIADTDALFAPLKFAIIGQHGGEIRRTPDVAIETLVDPAPLKAAAQRLKLLTDRFPGILIEEKGVSIAVHFRNAPKAESAVKQAVDDAAKASNSALEVMGGKMVWDLHHAGINKGSGVVRLMENAPFAGRIPVALGDDRTDEDSFKAARALGGIGILVGPPRETAARFRLPDPEACRNWLASLAS